MLGLLAACSGDRPPPTLELAGDTMGTRYRVQLMGPVDAPRQRQLAARIEADLDALNASLSNWDVASEISRFNRSAGDGWFPVTEHTATVVALALRVGRASGGALDPTVAPLVERWGFGPVQDHADPAQDTGPVGLDQVHVRHQPPALSKAHPAVRLDLSAVAKGYAVDQLLRAITELGVEDALVEIGGEVAARGNGPGGDGWRIGIEDPLHGGILRTLILRDAAVATSGDYRNYREIEGRRVTHLIDPRSARPIEHGLASVTVIADSAAEADAWATALAVLGRDAGLALAEEMDLSVWFGERGRDASGAPILLEFATNSMDRRLSREMGGER